MVSSTLLIRGKIEIVFLKSSLIYKHIVFSMGIIKAFLPIKLFDCVLKDKILKIFNYFFFHLHIFIFVRLFMVYVVLKELK